VDGVDQRVGPTITGEAETHLIHHEGEGNA
jgi:hypothetical protein